MGEDRLNKLPDIDVIRGWGISNVNVPAYRLLGPWEPFGAGEARPQSKPFLTLGEAEAARLRAYEFWEVAAVYVEQRQVWRNYESKTPAILIDVSVEQDAAEYGLGLRWVSPSWVEATHD